MGIPPETILAAVQDRIVNAVCLAEIISKAAYTVQADVFAVGSACEVLREYLNGTWDMAVSRNK